MFDKIFSFTICDIKEYDPILIGSGIQIGKWTKEPEKFLKKHQKDLAKKKVAIFVCCGTAKPLDENGKYLKQKADKYNLKPISFGFFGGVYNFNKVSWLFRKFMSSIEPQLKAASVKETEPGLYDTRDTKIIRIWAKELIELAKI